MEKVNEVKYTNKEQALSTICATVFTLMCVCAMDVANALGLWNYTMFVWAALLVLCAPATYSAVTRKMVVAYSTIAKVIAVALVIGSAVAYASYEPMLHMSSTNSSDVFGMLLVGLFFGCLACGVSPERYYPQHNKRELFSR